MKCQRLDRILQSSQRGLKNFLHQFCLFIEKLEIILHSKNKCKNIIRINKLLLNKFYILFCKNTHFNSSLGNRAVFREEYQFVLLQRAVDYSQLYQEHNSKSLLIRPD